MTQDMSCNGDVLIPHLVIQALWLANDSLPFEHSQFTKQNG